MDLPPYEIADAEDHEHTGALAFSSRVAAVLRRNWVPAGGLIPAALRAFAKYVDRGVIGESGVWCYCPKERLWAGSS